MLDSHGVELEGQGVLGFDVGGGGCHAWHKDCIASPIRVNQLFS